MAIEIGRLSSPIEINTKDHEIRSVSDCCMQIIASMRPDLRFTELETGEKHYEEILDPTDKTNIVTYGIDVSFGGTATIHRTELGQNGISTEGPITLDMSHPEHTLYIAVVDRTILIKGFLRYIDSGTTWYG